MSEIQDEKIEFSKEGNIIIKKEAFKNILIHALDYGNIYLDYSTQVMGFCIGNMNQKENKIEVTHTIPISHGDNIEIGFSENDRNALSRIQISYPNQVIGWYHSHPNFDLFFSKADKVNNLYFQNERNPFGFGIVIDPSKIKKNKSFGLEVYRLKDFKLGQNSDFVRVGYEIEFPGSLEFFKWIQGFVEDSEMTEPILIKEQQEVQERMDLDLQKIPFPEEKVPERDSGIDLKHVEPLISGLKEGTKIFSESIIESYRSELTNWEREFNQGTVQTTKKIQDSLKQMGLTVSDGLGKVENFINKNFKNRINEFNNEVYSLVKNRVKKQKESGELIKKEKEVLVNNFMSKVDESITQIYEDLKGSLDKVAIQLNEAQEENLTTENLISTTEEIITEIGTQIEDKSININKSIESITQPFESNLLKEYDKIISEIDPLQDTHLEIKNLIEKFQKIISDFHNLKK